MARIVVQPCVQLVLNELRVITTNIPTIAASLENVNKPWCPSNKCNCMQLSQQTEHPSADGLQRVCRPPNG